MILFGFQHCGKTTFGKKLARYLEMPFLDTDEMIGKRVGDFGKLFCENPKKFREIEKEVVQTLPKEHVIALGGGTILDEENRRHLENLGPLIYLKVSRETLQERYPNSKQFETIYAQRLPLYEAIEARTINLEESFWQAIQ